MARRVLTPGDLTAVRLNVEGVLWVSAQQRKPRWSPGGTSCIAHRELPAQRSACSCLKGQLRGGCRGQVGGPAAGVACRED